LAIIAGAFFAVVFGVTIEHAKELAARPMREAIAALWAEPTLYTTQFVLENGETVGMQMGWMPGRRTGETISYLSKKYEIVDVRAPALVVGEGEGTLVLRQILAATQPQVPLT